MEYKTSSDSVNLFEQFNKTVKRKFLFLTFVFVIFSFLIYSISNLDLPFYVSELVLFIGFAIIGYNQIISKGNIINNTALNVFVLNNEIVVITAPFKVIPWTDKKPKEVTLQIDNMNIRKTSYPIKEIYDLNNYAFKIGDKKKELYIIIDFFDSGLKEKLTNSRFV